MKVTSFTGTLYARRTPEHVSNHTSVESVKEYLGYSNVAPHEIYDIRMDEKNLLLSFKDSAIEPIAAYFKRAKMPFVILSETKNLLSVPIKTLETLI